MNTAIKLPSIQLTLDEALVAIVDKAVKETFSSFMAIQPHLISAQNQEVQDSEHFEISGIIAFIQNAIEGTLTIRFQKETAFKLLSRVYNQQISTIDSRIIGGVAELANVIHGIAKDELNSQGYDYQMCLPVVIIGENHKVVSILNGEKKVMKYDLDGDEVIIELVHYGAGH